MPSNAKFKRGDATPETTRRRWMGHEGFERMLEEVEGRVSATLDDHELPPADYGLHYFKPQPEHPRPDIYFETETRSLKHNIKRYCKEYYGYEITEEERNNFSLEYLASRNTALMNFVEFVADGGDNWKDIFTNGLYRRNLVYGVLCFALQRWVFSHTMFGATEDQLFSVQNIDTHFLMKDCKSSIV